MSKIEAFEIENPHQKRFSKFNDDEDDSINKSNLLDNEDEIGLNYGNKKKSNPNKSKNNFLRFKGDNEFYGVLNLMASTIGGGFVTFPSLLQTAGIITSLICFIIVSICVYFSLNLLRNFIISTNLFSLSGITKKLLGKRWLKIYAFSAVIFYLSIEINYVNLIVEYGTKGLFSMEENYLIIIFYLVSCILEIILCLYTSKISHIHVLSLISVFCFIFIVIVLLFYSFGSLMNEEIKDKFSSDKFFMPSNSFLKYIASICASFIEYVYSYSSHCSFPTLIGNLETKEEKTKRVVNIFFAFTTIMYIIISVFGYISQINIVENQKTLILFTEDYLHGYFNKFLQFIFILFFISLIPMRYIVIRDNYLSLFSHEITYKIELIFISVNMIIVNIISYFCSNDTNIIFSLNEIFGGVFGVVICFILPVIIYISINNKAEIKSILGYIMGIFFLIVGLFTAGYSFCEKILKII